MRLVKSFTITFLLLMSTSMVLGVKDHRRTVNTPIAEEETQQVMTSQDTHIPEQHSDLDSIPRNKSPTNASVLVLGLGGTGISATIRSIFKLSLSYDNDDSTNLYEYSVHVPSPELGIQDSYIKILDTPGLVISRSTLQDAAVITSIQKYMMDPEGLNGQYPTTVLVLSDFNENRASGHNSQFVRMLKRVELLKDFFNPPNSNSNANIIFVFTNLLSATRAESRRPQNQLKLFESIIKNYTTFPSPIVTAVAENRYEEYELAMQNGYHNLPNGQPFPKNIINVMIEAAMNSGDRVGEKILQDLYKNENRAHSEKVFPAHRDDNTESLAIRLDSENLQIASTEISNALQDAYLSLSPSLKTAYPFALQMLQLAFQKANITKKYHIPGTLKERTLLLKTIPLNPITTALLDKALSLKYPELTSFSVIGYGYDVLGDNSLAITPFEFSGLEPCAIGFSIPSITTCSIQNDDHDIFHLLPTYEDYSKKRQNELELTIAEGKYYGVLQSGYNCLLDQFGVPDKSRLSTMRQTRHFSLQLINNPPLNSEFLERIQSLAPFTSTNKESPREWNAFFNHFGTHVVSLGYGGGYMESSIAGAPLELILSNQDSQEFRQLQRSLPFFTDLSASLTDRSEITISFRFFGGATAGNTQSIPDLDEQQRNKVIEEWKKSLETEPVIFKSDVTLTPLSYYVKQYNESIGEMVETAANLLLQGKLKYERVRIVKPSTTTTTQRTTTTTTERITSTTTVVSIPTTKPSAPSTFTSSWTDQPKEYSKTVPNVPSYSINPSITAPSEVTKCLPKQEITSSSLNKKDYLENFVAQGYHIVKDIILSTSPFNFKFTKYGIMFDSHYYLLVNSTLKNCDKIHFMEFESFGEYAISRLEPLDSYARYDKQRFFRSIKPGNNIKSDKFSSKSVLLETRRKHVTLHRSLNQFISDNFITAVQNLPANYDDCKTSGIWEQFFDTFGTHFVTSGYLGSSQEQIMRGVSLLNYGNLMSKSRGRDCVNEDFPYLVKDTFVPLSIGLEYELICNLGPIKDDSRKFLQCSHAYANLRDGYLSSC